MLPEKRYNSHQGNHHATTLIIIIILTARKCHAIGLSDLHVKLTVLPREYVTSGDDGSMLGALLEEMPEIRCRMFSVLILLYGLVFFYHPLVHTALIYIIHHTEHGT